MFIVGKEKGHHHRVKSSNSPSILFKSQAERFSFLAIYQSGAIVGEQRHRSPKKGPPPRSTPPTPPLLTHPTIWWTNLLSWSLLHIINSFPGIQERMKEENSILSRLFLSHVAMSSSGTENRIRIWKKESSQRCHHWLCLSKLVLENQLKSSGN